ncbi:MAG TPA: 4-alpha-glucanotransferase [Pseudolabrys sp.]|nr:4-alpha-glucanotransferase [Pseudolabrys sp.]
MDDLEAAARHWGIEPEYYDVFGRRHAAGRETLARLIAAISAGRAQPIPFEVPAPQRAYQGDGRRLWAIAVQLYAVRSQRNWGHGDFTDLARLLRIAGAQGAAAIGLNPLHALFPDRADEASPYAPNSRLFLNPLYIDVEAVPEFPGTVQAGIADEIAVLRGHQLIDYANVARLKLKALGLAYLAFRAGASAERRADFHAYRHEQGETLLRFACFEVLRAQHARRPWPEWPQPWRSPRSEDLMAFRQAHEEDCEFQEFMQWLADRQLGACCNVARSEGTPIGLYMDIAVGSHPHGAEAWAQQDVMLAGVSAGAPPDEFNPGGQEWGVVPFNPQTMAADDFRAMRRLLRATMRHAGALRIDHVLGLKRLFMIPLGSNGGTYVRFPFEALLRVIAEESHHHRCIVIGEDLGTVPEGFHTEMARWGLWGCRVALFEREPGGGFRAPDCYPAEALASFNTHDLPSFRGWLEGYDLRVKGAIGVDAGESPEARAHSQAMLREALTRWAPNYPPDDVAAMAAFLAVTPCRLVAIALDDILGMRDQVNVPATTTQHPNWQQRLPVPLERLDTQESLMRVAQALAQRNFRA